MKWYRVRWQGADGRVHSQNVEASSAEEAAFKAAQEIPSEKGWSIYLGAEVTAPPERVWPR